MNVVPFRTPVDLADVSIVVLSHNRRDDLAANLKGLTRLADVNGCELIVVDNASTDGSPEMIASAIAGSRNARLISNAANLGVAAGRNVGWRAATREYILNIDDDTIVSADAVAVMLVAMRTCPELAIVSPRVLHARTRAAQCDHGRRACRIANFHGSCHMVRRACLERIGLNDEGCSFGGEELDVSIRARSAGFEIGYMPSATVLHDNIDRGGGEDGARRRRWLYNYVRIHHKHFPAREAWLFSTRYLFGHLVSGARAHGPFYAMTLIGAAIRGVLDGRRQYRPIPQEVVRFYRNPDLRPEFGNVPLWQKLTTKLGRWTGCGRLTVCLKSVRTKQHRRGRP